MGCSFGTFTLPALMLKRRVVAVDPNLRALKLLAKSVAENRFNVQQLSLVHNAVSDAYRELFLHVPDQSNVGGALVGLYCPILSRVCKSVFCKRFFPA